MIRLGRTDYYFNLRRGLEITTYTRQKNGNDVKIRDWPLVPFIIMLGVPITVFLSGQISGHFIS